MVFDGALYNNPELRDELNERGYRFFGNSDAEVVLKAYHAWGEACVEHFLGQWALCLWDRKNQILFCSRDRYGIKPLYYCLEKGMLYLGSEVKQMLITPGDKTLNKAMIWRSMKINSLLAYDDETYWQGIHSLKPGHNLIVGKDLTIKCYYELNPQNFESSTLSYPKAVEEYRRIFQESISLNLRCQVPIGAGLSGGLDSSAVVCAAVRHLGEPIPTFSSYYPDRKSVV